MESITGIEIDSRFRFGEQMREQEPSFISEESASLNKESEGDSLEENLSTSENLEAEAERNRSDNPTSDIEKRLLALQIPPSGLFRRPFWKFAIAIESSRIELAYQARNKEKYKTSMSEIKSIRRERRLLERVLLRSLGKLLLPFMQLFFSGEDRIKLQEYNREYFQYINQAVRRINH